MGKKRGKNKGGKNKSAKKPPQSVVAEESQQDAPPTANEAETGVVDAAAAADDVDVASSTLPPPARPSLDAAAHEESFRQSLLNVIGSVEDDGDNEANADSSPDEQAQNVAQDVLKESNDDDNKEDIVDDSSANADDVTVPHSNSIEHIDGDGDGDLAGIGKDDDLPQLPDEPIITTSFGSNSVEDELNALPDISTDMAVDRRGVSEEDQDVEDNVNNDDEDAVVSVESESASQVTSDFTLGGYSTVSKDSAIAALASLDREHQHEDTTGGVANDGSISPLHLTKGVSAEEGEDTNALPPLDASVDVSPEISLAGSEDGGDEEGEGIDADEELDRDEGKFSAAAAATAAALGGAGAALGVALIAGGGEGDDLGAAGEMASAPMASEVDPVDDMARNTQINAPPVAGEDNIVTADAGVPGLKGDAAADVALPSCDNAEEGGANIQGSEETASDNPFDSFVSREESVQSDEDSDKEWVSSVLSAGTAGAAVAGGAAALCTNSQEVDNLGAEVADSGTSVDGPASFSPDDNDGKENLEGTGEGEGDNNKEEEEEDDGDDDDANNDDENANKVGPLAVAAGVVGAAAIAGAGAAVAAGSAGNNPPSLATEDNGNMADDGQYYSHGTFSEDEESCGDEGSGEGRDKALVAVGVVGAAGIAAAVAGGLQSAPEHTRENEEEFTVISPSKSLVGESPVEVSTERDIDGNMADEAIERLSTLPAMITSDIEEGMPNESPAAGSFAAASSPHGSANDPSPTYSRNKIEVSSGSNKKKKLLTAAGALVLVGGIVGIALAFTLGRNDNDKSIPATSSPTPYPIDPRPPTPSNLPTPGTPLPTASPIDGNLPPSQTSPPPTQAPTSQAPTSVLESGVPTRTPQSNAPTQPRPTTSSPTSLEYAETVEELQTFLGDVVPNPAALEDPDSPQYEAVSWLASDLVAKGVSRRMLQETSPEEIAITQRYALATLWFATGGERWTIVAESEDSQWLSPGPECDWEGVICSRQVITKLRDNSRANSTKPQGMQSYLRNRRILQLSSASNETMAPTATSTAQTTTLEPTPSPTTIPVEADVLVVTGLEIEEINLNGRIPADIVLLSGLKHLAASNNAITRIPSEMGALTQLERLILNNNRIRGRIPAELGNLSRLIDLRLNDNEFVKKIPSALGNLLSLDSLELHHNELSGTMPDLVCSLRYLGEDDVLDRLTSDCASNRDVVPAKVECDCCTECYVSTDDFPTAASLTLPEPTVAKTGETNAPTMSPTSKPDTASGTPTVKETTEPIVAVNQSQEGIESPEVEGSGSSVPPSSEELIGDNSGARNEIQGRDSNDWYELLYEEQKEQIANGQL